MDFHNNKRSIHQESIATQNVYIPKKARREGIQKISLYFYVLTIYNRKLIFLGETKILKTEIYNVFKKRNTQL